MTEKRTCKEAKSLRWLANMYMELKIPKMIRSVCAIVFIFVEVQVQIALTNS